MKSIIRTKKSRVPVYLWLIGAAAGFVNGFLGAGGGIILVFTLSAMYKSEGERRVKDVFAMSVAAILPISVVSVLSYSFNTHADFTGCGKFIVPAVIGGLCGAFLSEKIKTSSLKILFALITVFAGVNMMLK